MRLVAMLTVICAFSAPTLAGDWAQCLDLSKSTSEQYNNWLDVVKNCSIYPPGFASRGERLTYDFIELCERACDGRDDNQMKVREACSMYRQSISYSKAAYPCN